MRIALGGEIVDRPAVWLADEQKGVVRMIDQRFIPWRIKIFESKNVETTSWAIKNFVVRGAPTIGATAALGAYQAFLEASIVARQNYDMLWKKFSELINLLERARPTAYNLFHAVNSVKNYLKQLLAQNISLNEITDLMISYVKRYVDDIVKKNYQIGIYGEKLIEDGYRILTHCNAGALAAVDLGTATAPIYMAHRNGKRLTVYIDETRPWLQGARLTAWEMQQEGIPYYVISDNAAGYLMFRGEIDIVIVGADRIAVNGDVANKIGTYKLALAARDNGIPFYVAAPTSTIDPDLREGKEIPIENRSENEIHFVLGEYGGEIISVRITPIRARAINPVFDITPSRLITGIITEYGVFRPDEIETLLKKIT